MLVLDKLGADVISFRPMGKQWKKTQKGESAIKKGLLFTKLAREIYVATKSGGSDINFNPRLRMAVEAAKKVGCPSDTIDRAIKKGMGLLDDGKIIEEVMYEGYGPHGVGVLVECQTDNRHRTAPEVRNVFKKHEGNMGESNSVAWMFARVGLIEATKPGTYDLEEEAIEAGANDVEKREESIAFFTSIEDLETVRGNLVGRGWTVTTFEPSYKATNLTTLTDEQMAEVEEFLNALDDLDDSHRVHVTI